MRAQVMAHRGASRVEQENTIAAFHRAKQMGADAVELDVRLSHDRRMVVHHDPHLADGRVICRIKSDEIPAHIPQLHDALDACAGMWVNIEIKNDPNEPDFDDTEALAELVANHLRGRNESERWLISSFRRETIESMRRHIPEVATAWLTTIVDVADEESLADDLARSGHRALHPWVGGVTERLVDVFHSRGLTVNTWTCDDPVRMRELLDWGIDGICTNVPDVALDVRAGH